MTTDAFIGFIRSWIEKWDQYEYSPGAEIWDAVSGLAYHQLRNAFNEIESALDDYDAQETARQAVPDWTIWLTDKEKELLADLSPLEPWDPVVRRLMRRAELRSRRAVIRKGVGILLSGARVPMVGVGVRAAFAGGFVREQGRAPSGFLVTEAALRTFGPFASQPYMRTQAGLEKVAR